MSCKQVNIRIPFSSPSCQLQHHITDEARSLNPINPHCMKHTVSGGGFLVRSKSCCCSDASQVGRPAEAVKVPFLGFETPNPTGRQGAML